MAETLNLVFFPNVIVPAYLSDSLQLTANVQARHRLRSTDTVMLQVPPTRRSTLGDRAFPVAAARAWNGLAAACNMFLQLIAAVPARDKSISVPVVLL